MTEQDKQGGEKTETAKKDKKAKPTLPVKVADKQGATGLAGPYKAIAIVALVLSLLAAAASAYLWQSAQQQQLALLTELAGAKQQLEDQQQLLRTVQRDIDQQTVQTENLNKQQQANLQGVQRQLHSHQQRLISLSTTSREDWLLAEVEYLLRLAEQRLLTAGDSVGAMGLLQAADEIARELDDSALFPFRKTLADNLAALRVAAKLDIEGVYLQLDALAEEVKQLELFAAPSLPEQAVSVDTSGDWQQTLQQGAEAAWQKLQQHIQIRRRDDIYQPVLAPEHEAALRHNTQLMFEQAQMALLAGNDSLYQKSLEKAEGWLQEFYTLQPELTKVVVDSIESLKARTIKAELPDISSSRRALKAYVDQLHQLPETSKDEQEAEQ